MPIEPPAPFDPFIVPTHLIWCRITPLPTVFGRLVRVIVAVALLLQFGAALAATRVVLPTNVIPLHYDLDITTHAENMVFTGKVSITVDVIKPTRTIVMNAAELSIDKVTVDGTPLSNRGTINTARQTVTIAVPTPLSAGRHTISMEYAGRIYPHAAGLFALDYDTAGGEKRALFTQFENAEARRFLPCWDEPGRKATFTLTANVPDGLMAVSNMPITSTLSLQGKRQRIRFAETPQMSSYLLFFALGDFERIARKVQGIDIGVVVKHGDTARAEFALDAAAHLLPYYNNYFGLPYPLPKLDLVAGPGEAQSFDAMENWGAIFYFENALLMDPKISTQEDMRNIYVTVAHEMSHQWFGDLVTMDWWDDIWLNEGFASWMEDKAPQQFHPEWDFWLDEQNNNESAIRVDSRAGTHPIVRPILDANQASEAFDTITYQKGQAIVRMLESYVGADAFRDAVRRYLKAHAYGNSTTDDLWRELDKTAAMHISTIAHDFTLQAGVPMIRVRIEGNAAHLSMEQFSAEHSHSETRNWHVPVVARLVSSKSVWRGVISRGKEATIPLTDNSGIVVNVGQAGYYRTLYEPEALSMLIEHFSDLLPQEQLGLLNDSRALGYSGYAPLSDFLRIASAVTPRTDPGVLYTLAGRLRGIDDLYGDEAERARYRLWARNLLGPLLASIGIAPAGGESHIIALLRGALIYSLSTFDDPTVIQEARARFAAYLQMPSTLSADRRFNVLSVVAMHADAPTWEALHRLASQSKSNLEKSQLYELLGTATDRDLAIRALQLTLTDEAPLTTRPTIIDNVSFSHPDLALEFLDTHYDAIVGAMEPDSRAEYAPNLVRESNDPAMIDRLRKFSLAHIPSESRQPAIQAEAEIAYNAIVRKARLPEVNRWLQSHPGSASAQSPASTR